MFSWETDPFGDFTVKSMKLEYEFNENQLETKYGVLQIGLTVITCVTYVHKDF